ncbi:MAG TPA: hypothetical protein VF456_25755 [Vicinamibacterales bacterium]
MRAKVFAVALILWSGRSVNAHERLTMVVSPVQSFAPTDLTVRIHVEPDPDNRVLEVVAESGEYYSSSRVQLDGADAPRTISLSIHHLPGGDYDVQSTLFNGAGHARGAVHKQVNVLKSEGSG